MNKLVVVTLAMVLVASMAYAGVASNGLLWAKKSHESESNDGDSGTGSSGHSGDSGSSGSPNNDKHDDKGPSEQEQEKGSDQPAIVNEPVKDIDNKPVSTTGGFACADSSACNSDKPITPNPNPNPNPITNPVLPQTQHDKTPIDFNCHFHPDKCVPDVPGQCPGGFASNDHGNCHPVGPCPPGFGRHDNDESGKCFHNGSPSHSGHNTKVIVIHKTKTIHKRDLVHTATVFVPGVGLVEPFNCKLNEKSGKIGCEFIIIKVIN